MAKQNNSLRQRLSYWFDNMMAQGMWPKIRLLLYVTLIFVALVGLIAFFADTETIKDIPEGIWKTLLLVLGKGGQGEVSGKTAPYAVLMLLVVFYAMFFMATLIGLINTGIRTKIDSLGKGRGQVLESGHTLILGFNEATFVLLEELINANSNLHDTQVVVILDEVERTEMENAIRAKFGRSSNHPKTKIICRTGSYYNFANLERCSLQQSRAVIINAENDFETTKAIMACSAIFSEQPGETMPYAVAVIHETRNLGSAHIAEGSTKLGDWLELIPVQSIMARIMVHTSRQPGLSEVFTELFNFAQNEFYLVREDASFAHLRGKSIAEINLYLKEAIAVGVLSNGRIKIDSPQSTVFNEGDALIVVEAEDNALRVTQEASPVDTSFSSGTPLAEATNVLVLGENILLEDLLSEYAHYLKEGSSVYLAAHGLDPAAVCSESLKTSLSKAGITLNTYDRDISNKHVLERIIIEAHPDSIVVLANNKEIDLEKDDERLMQLLLYLREIRDRNKAEYSITSEMNRNRNRELAAATGPDDFIIGRQFSALIMAQVSYNRGARDLFDTILSQEGFEVYMKKASRYVPTGVPLDLFTVGALVAKQDEIFVGIRQYTGGHYADAVINPPKFKGDMMRTEEYVFGEDDYFVVLADSMD